MSVRHVQSMLMALMNCIKSGTGLSAKSIEQGGADLILVYNSGRFRMAGRGSLAGMMPYSDANAVVVDMVYISFLLNLVLSPI